MDPLISLIVPVYKSEDYLERCLNSLINQTYKNIEIILIYNHDALDKCPAICTDFAIKYKNIRLIHQKDLGPSAARNAGIDIAKGKYLAFIDSDDFIHSKFIEHLKDSMENSGALLSMCGYEKFPNRAAKKNLKKLDSTPIQINDLMAFQFLLNDQALCAPWAKLYDASLFQDLRFPITRNEDMFLMPEIFKKAKKISITFNKLYSYSQEGPSLVRSPHTFISISQYFEANQFWKNFATKNYPEITELAELHFYKNVLNICKAIRGDKRDDIRELYNNLKGMVLSKTLHLLFSKNFLIRDKVKLILFKINLM